VRLSFADGERRRGRALAHSSPLSFTVGRLEMVPAFAAERRDMRELAMEVVSWRF
jgi:hypothetical protein